MLQWTCIHTDTGYYAMTHTETGYYAMTIDKIDFSDEMENIENEHPPLAEFLGPLPKSDPFEALQATLTAFHIKVPKTIPAQENMKSEMALSTKKNRKNQRRGKLKQHSPWRKKLKMKKSRL